MVKKSLVFLLTLALLLSMLGGYALASGEPSAAPSAEASADASAESSPEASAETQTGKSTFALALESRFIDPDRVFSSDVRWWLGSASATDDTLLEEIQAMYDGGFRGAELCMQDDNLAPNSDYAYGSDMWAHKWKLMMNTLLDLGMSVYLTSGTNWATSNVPESYMSPDSQEASQSLFIGTVLPVEEDAASDESASGEASGSASGEAVTLILAAGERVESALPIPSTLRNNCKLVGVYAYEIDPDGNILYGTDIDLMAESGAIFQKGGDTDYLVIWTAPAAGEQGADARYLIIPLWTQGTYQSSSPAIEPCYATNYFDSRGVEALRRFWEDYILNDPELNEKIMAGDVQLFMDSIELNFGGGITWWSEDMRQEFIDRKGYDALPYVLLVKNIDAGGLTSMGPYRELKGDYDLADNAQLREKLINDWCDVLTQLYEENMLKPLADWLHTVGITTRAQISYGKTLEITEPSVWVDYPEAENLNQYNQIDQFRLHTAGAKLQNKVLSTESGGTNRVYGTSTQILLRDAYSHFAAGFQRMIWHIWTATYGYGNYNWPGYMAGMGGDIYFNRWGTRDPSSAFYDEFNDHISRVQELMRTGTSRTDIGFIHNNWAQGMKNFGDNYPTDLEGMNWELAHMGVFYRSTELQDNGYTYDYLSPDLLTAEGVYFNPETKTIELAGYRALVIYQRWLDPDAALLILDWAEQGLPVVILEHAAQATPFNDGRDAELAETIAKLEALDNVRVAQINGEADDFDYFDAVADGYDDDVYEALQELGVQPYAGFDANHQLLTQSREDADGSRYLYVYNYCSNDYHEYSVLPEIWDEDHGLDISTEVRVDGIYIPYEIDAWTGEVTELGEYRYENGQTVIPLELTYGNIKLFAFEPADGTAVSVTDTNADLVYAGEDGLVARALTSGRYTAKLSTGETKSFEVTVPEAYDITDWNVTVESWTANEEAGDLVREETIDGLTTVNRKTSTVVTEIPVKLDTLTTWDNIPEVGIEVSGVGYYEATFNWDASAADGAYIDFGETLDQAMVVWINDVKVGGEPSTNPTKAPKSVGAEIGDGMGGSYIPEGKVEYTGGISWTKPIADISDYLVDGENTIRIEYRSALTNATLTAGIITPLHFQEGSGWGMLKWFGYDVDYRSSGPQQAVIVPFVDTAL